MPRSEQTVITIVNKLVWPGGAVTTTAVFDDQVVTSTAVCPILFAPVISTVAKFWPEIVASEPPSLGAFAPENVSRAGLSNVKTSVRVPNCSQTVNVSDAVQTPALGDRVTDVSESQEVAEATVNPTRPSPDIEKLL